MLGAACSTCGDSYVMISSEQPESIAFITVVNPTHPNAINIHKLSLILPSMGGNYICNYHPQMDGLLLGLNGFTTLLALTVPNSGHHLRAKSRSGVAASSLRAPCRLGRGDSTKEKTYLSLHRPLREFS